MLLLTSVLPWPLHRNGGGQRTALWQRALATRCEVETWGIIPYAPDGLPPAATLREAGVTRAFDLTGRAPPASPLPRPVKSLHELILRQGQAYEPIPEVARAVGDALASGRFDLVVSRYLATACGAGLLSGSAGPVPVRVDLDDVDWLTLADRLRARPWAGLGGKLGMALTLRTVRRRALTAARRAQGLAVASPSDAQALAEIGLEAAVIPNIPFDAGDLSPLPPATDSRNILFVGDLQHGPNVDGLSWFLEEVWPDVLRARPETRFRIVGRGLSGEQRTAWSAVQGVEVAGFAPDLRQAYADAAVTIAPMQWGGGTSIKVAESVMLGRPVVSTYRAARGYDMLIGHGITLADAPEAFARALVDLLDQSENREELTRQGVELAQATLSFGPFASRVLAFTRASDLPMQEQGGVSPSVVTR